MLSGCPELEAQKKDPVPIPEAQKDTLCQSWKLKKAPPPPGPSFPAASYV